jgi:DNA-binding CsgD family transcriptional regulator
MTTNSIENIINITPKEKEVLFLLIQGDTNIEIAQKQNCSVNCIKLHVAHLMQKFRAKNRTHLAFLANSFLKF